MRLLPLVSMSSVFFLAAAGCSSAPDVDGALTQQVTRALSRATDPSLSPAESRDRSTETLAAAIAAMNVRANVHAENVLNVNTIAYKRRVVVQSDSLDVSTRLDLAQGTTEMTDRELDVAINGAGFFRVKIPADAKTKSPDGVAYTRCGNFYINADGELCLGMRDGPTLVPAIMLPRNAASISIAEDGTVSATITSSADSITVGRLELTTFDRPECLMPLESGLFAESVASGQARVANPNEDGMGYLAQGMLEGSNVDFTREFLLMSRIAGQREMLQKLIAKRD